MEKVIAVFDIGKTNKKLLLFNCNAQLVYQHEEIFPVIHDSDGFECDDIERIELWIKESLFQLAKHSQYDVKGVNFSTYGASLAFVDKNGKRLSPIFNYLKPINEVYAQQLYQKYGGTGSFCRQTASPALGMMLNSGIQLLWIKKEHPQILKKTSHILHFPQYLSFLLTQKAVSEYTSIGCHTFMWNFDKMDYHQWLTDECFVLPTPVSNSSVTAIDIEGKKIDIGVGIHDSSASLVPYFQGFNEKFLLISTGTWCINMNPFNYTPLTDSELQNDCLCYLSVNQKPVKSSRLFMGHIHDVNRERIQQWFNADKDAYKNVAPNLELIGHLCRTHQQRFFKNGISSNYIDETVDLNHFGSFSEAYHQLMFDLTTLCVNSIKLVLDEQSQVNNLFVSGGFSRNMLFINFLSHYFPDKNIYTTEVDNSSALGAALVIMEEVLPECKPRIDLGLKQWKYSI